MKKNIKVEVESKKFKLNKKDMLKLAKSFGLGVGGFVIAFLLDAMTAIDWGTYTPIVYSLSPVLANLLRTWIPDNSK